MRRENNLREFRKAKHQTQLRLSQRSGVHRSLICFFETGFRTPNISHKRRLAGALGISMRGIWPEKKREKKNPTYTLGNTILTGGGN
jgi:transcriptional regulator with XRE-family HTH domain